MKEELRESLWVALSDLWLDTEIQAEGLRSLATRIREAECSPRELEEICRYELAPFLGGNLVVAAGVWDGFDPDWVVERARRWRSLSRSRWGRWRARGASWLGGGVRRLGDNWYGLNDHAYGRVAQNEAATGA